MIKLEVTYLYSKEDNFDKKLSEFLRLRNISNIDIEKNVLDIINQVKTNGDSALINMINKFDKITCTKLENIRIENKLLKKAFDELLLI